MQNYAGLLLRQCQILSVFFSFLVENNDEVQQLIEKIIHLM